MYLQAIKVRPRDREVEFSYPKMISKDEIEFMAIKVDKYNHNIDGYYVSDGEGRIPLRKTKIFMNSRKFKIIPIAKRLVNKDNQCNYIFYIDVYEIVNDIEKLCAKVQCDLSKEDLYTIHNVFTKAVEERKQKAKSIEKMEVSFWYPEYKDKNIDLFNDLSICFSSEVNEFASKECWEKNTYLEDSYLRDVLEFFISKKYGFQGLFSSMTLRSASESRDYRFDIKGILNHMNEKDKDICKFTLGSILLQK